MSPQFEDYSRTLTKADQPHRLGSLPFTAVGRKKPKNKVIPPCLSSAHARGRRRGGGVGKKTSVRTKKSSNLSKVVQVRKPLQKVNENSVDSGSDSDIVSAPLPNRRAAARPQQVTKTSRFDVMPMQQSVPCSCVPTCTSNTENTIQSQPRQDFSDYDSNSGGVSQGSTQVADRGNALTFAQPKSTHKVEESQLQSQQFSQSSFNSTHPSRAEHKLSGGSSQNMDQTSCHLQLTKLNPPQPSSNHPTSRVCSYPPYSEQNIKRCHLTSQRLGEPSHFHSSPPKSIPTSHMPSTSTMVPSVARLTHYSTSAATKTTSTSRTCLQWKQQEVCDLNQMVSTMNIEDKTPRSLTGVKLNQNSEYNTTFSLTDFHPKFASTPYTAKRVTRHGIVCHTPLTIVATPSKSNVFRGTEQDGYNTAGGSGGQNEDVSVWAPETPAHLMVSLRRGSSRERCRRRSCTGDLCVIDDTLG